MEPGKEAWCTLASLGVLGVLSLCLGLRLALWVKPLLFLSELPLARRCWLRDAMVVDDA